jgi:hypothetical protein
MLISGALKMIGAGLVVAILPELEDVENWSGYSVAQ